MPVYATVSDLEKLISKQILIQLTDDSRVGQVDDDVAIIHLENAEAEVNAALSAGGYTVPASVPLASGCGIVKAATLWLATCGLAARRGVIPDDYKSQCEFYRDVLKKIGEGTMVIPLPSSVNEPHSNTLEQEKIFTRSKVDHSGNVLNSEEQGSLDTV